MNRIWPILILIACVLLIVGDANLIIRTMLGASSNALNMSIRLIAIYAVWMGILKILDATGFSKVLAKALRPVIRFLFGDIPKETQEYISLNFSANMLGLGGAATPLGIKAIESMNKGYNTATTAMIMLVVISSASIQLIPTSVISLREDAGSVNASGIILPNLIANFGSTALGIALVKILSSIFKDKKVT